MPTHRPEHKQRLIQLVSSVTQQSCDWLETDCIAEKQLYSAVVILPCASPHLPSEYYFPQSLCVCALFSFPYLLLNLLHSHSFHFLPQAHPAAHTHVIVQWETWLMECDLFLFDGYWYSTTFSQQKRPTGQPLASGLLESMMNIRDKCKYTSVQ